ncbi:MAG: hypothetical protein A2W03_04640 [Candidatus Aminicenantes bacterium RBG_16_63_16]|nr:MAG: hypothetical protein A2W03_04640 [Candidatus Aminicenantes bacterium RBG_16_63_16]
MKRRDFVVMMGSAPLVLAAGRVPPAGSPRGGALVATPEKRSEYARYLLERLCTDIGPHPAGTPEFARAAALIKKEMEISLPEVAYDTFAFERWELSGEPEFRLGNGQGIEACPSFGGEGTPAEGISGMLSEDGKGFALVDPETGKPRAKIYVSQYGPAIPHHRARTSPPSIPVFGIGKQDVPLIANAIRDKIPARYKAVVRFVPGATGMNIIGRLPGKRPDEILVVAHADTVYGAPGGNDNIASVIVMLMMAHAAAAGTAFNHTLTFVATDAEEFGMLGANHYGAKRAADGTMKNIRYVANFDSLTYGPNLWISSKDQSVKDVIAAIHRDLNIRAVPKFDDSDGFVMDSAPFRPSGAKAFHANSRGYDEKTLPIYHRPDDNAFNVPLDCVEIGFRVFTEYIRRVDKL